MLFDASISKVNHQIKPLDQHECPGLAEYLIIQRKAQVLQAAPDEPPVSRYGLLKFDVKGAHRSTRRRRKDWKVLSMWLGDSVWINLVGAFGESSASYWWARLYAALHRLLYHILAK